MLVQESDTVALPLTSFKPVSINIISRVLIKLYDRAIIGASKSTRMKYLTSPGRTKTLVVKAFETVGENDSAAYVPTSKNTSLTPARQTKSGPAMI